MLYQKILRPLLFKLDPENAHELATRSLQFLNHSKVGLNLLKRFTENNGSAVDVFGLQFPNCVGQAAGLDKNALFPAVSQALGFGHVEVGTVTPNAQPGNDRPRLFRYPDHQALINRMGFNNDGVDALATRTENSFPKISRKIPLGINLGKGKETPLENALSDYCYGLTKVSEIADYVTINISSPNTPELRKLHQFEFLDPLLSGIRSHRTALKKIMHGKSPPCLLKISPDESFRSLEYLTLKAIEHGFDGIIACNTSVNRGFLSHSNNLPEGGISGKPIGNRSIEVIQFIAKLTDFKFPIIGSGGVHDYDTAAKVLNAGASLLQIYTSFIYRGPMWPKALAKQISNNQNWL